MMDDTLLLLRIKAKTLLELRRKTTKQLRNLNKENTAI